MKDRSSSLAGRALLALFLTVGFYALALVLVAGLLYTIYAQVHFANRINIRFTLLALGGAITILAAIVPRQERFVAPGPRLALEKHPNLEQVIREIAGKTAQKIPSSYYLIPNIAVYPPYVKSANPRLKRLESRAGRSLSPNGLGQWCLSLAVPFRLPYLKLGGILMPD